ncbi:hypothetical protein OIE62_07615 [Streptomyces scopuliridis]|uniref:Uncharacterized protein n=1 Tax=Streptomyces scopuliridis TaxID=452529 RepID=A0ACD4ZX00_9ACTN|nr:hypothetical protein [Streptomyces scopuliridis]WSC01567.1 hypothetical protein OG835_34205 [Streptomyces scopuliridis]WSC04895.1 hypothetical protein OIE62_07615 [Streptomyces scopuliridis]
MGTGMVDQTTLDYLAERLDDLAGEFPGSAVEVDLVTLTDHIGVLTHHLDNALGRAQDRFTATETVYPPERRTLAQLAEATVGITRALNVLAEALAHATQGYRKEAHPGDGHSHLRNDPATALIIAAEKYADARVRLTDVATAMRPTPAAGGISTPRSTALPATPAPVAGIRQAPTVHR